MSNQILEEVKHKRYSQNAKCIQVVKNIIFFEVERN